MHANTLFRTWLSLGLLSNLALASANTTTAIGPLWLWLIVLPLLAYALRLLPEALELSARCIGKRWRHRNRAQAVRVRPRT
jgi:hypothetical protein